MKLYYEMIRLLFNKYIRKYENGRLVKDFCENMGVVYIKLAQMLSAHSFGSLFTEKDRIILSGVCSSCKHMSFDEVKKVLETEFQCSVDDVFLSIDSIPIGAASISQVHKATLKSGETVAVKIKRKGVTENVDKEIKQIKRLMYTFGKFLKFGNFSGFDRALHLYLDWIYQETDFTREANNINTYTKFANSVNGKIEGNKLIRVPKYYPELCTNNVIVMEYIEHKTLNNLDLTEENNSKIRNALNSYISSSLYAMFNDLKIVFHGDPHSGNIYIDDDGNIGFLDMGLLFELTDEDVKETKDFFFAIYKRDYDRIYNLVIPYGKMDESAKEQFKNDIKLCCDSVINKPATSYFIDFMNVCLKYEVCPPNFLFCLAKAFLCLDGINKVCHNQVPGTELLKEQVVEFHIKNIMRDTHSILIDSIKVFPSFTSNTCRYGLIKGIAKGVVENDNIYEKAKQALENYREILEMIHPVDELDKCIEQVLKKMQ
ncbi:MAG: AarF/ABC1/UbiB kinase family protein [Firmicutes bacterium]|nr:AarF/ABC1/UbiB kinase family protein [Bacillota bacterium]